MSVGVFLAVTAVLKVEKALENNDLNYRKVSTLVVRGVAGAPLPRLILLHLSVHTP